jgi:ketosteroid isomerase-like protein
MLQRGTMTQPALRSANEAFYAAFESLDIAKMTTLWARSQNVTCVHPGWDVVVGLEEVLQSWRNIFEGTSQIQFRVEIESITAGSELGWVVCREILLTSVQGMAVENSMTAINTFALEEGQWRIAHHHAAPMLAGRGGSKRPRPPENLLH